MKKEYELIGENILSSELEDEGTYIVSLNGMPILSTRKVEEVEAVAEWVDLTLIVLYAQGRLKSKE